MRRWMERRPALEVTPRTISPVAGQLLAPHAPPPTRREGDRDGPCMRRLADHTRCAVSSRGLCMPCRDSAAFISAQLAAPSASAHGCVGATGGATSSDRGGDLQCCRWQRLAASPLPHSPSTAVDTTPSAPAALGCGLAADLGPWPGSGARDHRTTAPVQLVRQLWRWPCGGCLSLAAVGNAVVHARAAGAVRFTRRALACADRGCRALGARCARLPVPSHLRQAL